MNEETGMHLHTGFYIQNNADEVGTCGVMVSTCSHRFIYNEPVASAFRELEKASRLGL